MQVSSAFDALKLETRSPGDQNALDILRGRWISDFSRLRPGLVAGNIDLFDHDLPRIAAQELGHGGKLHKFDVLELGPLEGAHSYQLEALGANSVFAIEANPEAYVKCLITKEILRLQRVQFMLGDFVRHLEESTRRYDLVFASGVLYHMSNPLHLLRLIASRTDKLFLWTHFFDSERAASAESRTSRRAIPVCFEGINATYYVRNYDDIDISANVFLGGNELEAAWMQQSDILRSLSILGFDRVKVISVNLEQHAGPFMSLVAWRTGRARWLARMRGSRMRSLIRAVARR